MSTHPPPIHPPPIHPPPIHPPPIHPPKRETFDLVARTNTDPKGIVRDVDEYRLTPWGLYMARPTPGRDQFGYLESWLLPELGLRVSVFHFNPGHERDQDFYLDVAQISVGAERWETNDHYLDVVVRTGRGADLVDVDELLQAHRDGLVTTETARAALQCAVSAVEGLAVHSYDLNAWLGAIGVQLSWR
jgi:predicted RNA-binding protein associated with RNAse of E/G family